MPYSIYLHIPFCRHRCAYCDFNTYAGLEHLLPTYIDALCREITCFAPHRLVAHTVFFGGGTPSLLPIPALEQIFQALNDAFHLQPDVEISLEANPGTLRRDELRELRALGINRLSLGAQTTHPQELRMLERQHDFGDVIHAAAWARQAGFDNLNLDLIYGIPGQTLSSWEDSLFQAMRLHPEHLSLYALTIEENTPFHQWLGRGLMDIPDPDLAADMYDLATERLASAGFVQYEISNWAREVLPSPMANTQLQLACRHNLQYWRNRPYLGLGAGAHGYTGSIRSANVLHPAEYISRMHSTDKRSEFIFPRTPVTAYVTEIDRAAEIAETMMMGLRLTIEGVSKINFYLRFGQDLEAVFGIQIQRLCALGLLEWAGNGGDRLRLTPRGRLLGNQVFMEFV